MKFRQKVNTNSWKVENVTDCGPESGQRASHLAALCISLLLLCNYITVTINVPQLPLLRFLLAQRHKTGQLLAELCINTHNLGKKERRHLACP